MARPLGPVTHGPSRCSGRNAADGRSPASGPAHPRDSQPVLRPRAKRTVAHPLRSVNCGCNPLSPSFISSEIVLATDLEQLIRPERRTQPAGPIVQTQRHQQGLTLIELLVVVIILGVLAAVGATLPGRQRRVRRRDPLRRSQRRAGIEVNRRERQLPGGWDDLATIADGDQRYAHLRNGRLGFRVNGDHALLDADGDGDPPTGHRRLVRVQRRAGGCHSQECRPYRPAGRIGQGSVALGVLRVSSSRGACQQRGDTRR